VIEYMILLHWLASAMGAANKTKLSTKVA